MLPPIVQIVKRFGPVGGMETYVWKLVRGLSERDCRVSVICEQIMGEVPLNVEVLMVEKGREKPRWKSMLIFRERVDALLKDRYKDRSVIIHSHERSISHQLTTFHGPPIDVDGKLTWLRYLMSPRLRAWKRIERHELLSPRVQFVLPVSSKVKKALLNYYPDLANKQLKLGWPGVDRPLACESSRGFLSTSPVRLLFVGKEWKRKGLSLAVDIVARFRMSDPRTTLDVYGVNVQSVPKRIQALTWIRFRGWCPRVPWADYRALIHPAVNEPFGMVVSEARAHGLSVLMSDKVGASDLNFDHSVIVPLDASLDDWVSELRRLLSAPDVGGEVTWTWDDLVNFYCEMIYPKIKIGK